MLVSKIINNVSTRSARTRLPPRVGADPYARPVQNLLDLQHTYVKHLELLNKLCTSVTAQKSELKLSPDDLARLFCNTDELFEHSKEFAQKFEDVLRKDGLDPINVAKFLSEQSKAILPLYEQYVCNLCRAAQLLEELKTNKTFAGMLRGLEHASAVLDEAVDADFLLAAPSQFLRTLVPALEELLDAVPVDDDGWNALADAIDALVEIAETLTASEVEAKKVAEVAMVQRKITGLPEDLAQPHRTYRYESDVMLLAPNQKLKEGRPVFPQHRLYLFSDVLLLVSKSGRGFFGSTESYKYVAQAPLRTMRIAEASETETGCKSAFTVKWDEVHDFETLTLATVSPAQCNHWIDVVTAALQDVKKTQLFGVDLSVVMENREKGRDIPYALDCWIEYLREKALSMEGIMRISGQQKEIGKMQVQYDLGLMPELKDVNNVAGVLKLWLRLMPDPLLTNALASEWTAFTEKPAEGKERHLTKKMRATVAKLPKHNQYVLRSLLSLLADVAAHGNDNQMTPSNLSLVFTPSLVPDASTMPGRAFGIVENLIRFHEAIFSDVAAEQDQLRATGDPSSPEAKLAKRRQLRQGLKQARMEAEQVRQAAENEETSTLSAEEWLAQQMKEQAERQAVDEREEHEEEERLEREKREREEEEHRLRLHEIEKENKKLIHEAKKRERHMQHMAEEEARAQETREERQREFLKEQEELRQKNEAAVLAFNAEQERRQLEEEERQRQEEEEEGEEGEEGEEERLESQPKCAACGKPIETGGVQALGKQWHRNCFVCAGCNKQFSGGFATKDGKPYCQACAGAASPPAVCSACGKPVSGSVLRALNKPWHPDCFVCNKCKTPLAGKGFFDPGDGSPICKACAGQQ
eukprot:TRINITY_DN2815_c0_g1_i2.p1 TRINITY_DN2815_c0_g1~~TRINITY_DN2815_c0_g1_i2.p1  ORF type:complete len:869 (-),score=235.79 TRINITY_DN2815_c0_g1_i2:97-2703(-)